MSRLTSELLASGIPADVHPQLGYRSVTAAEALELVGYKLSGWVVPMNDPEGKPFTHEGKPFYRLKPDPGQLKGDDAPRYLSPKGAGCRPYFSPLMASGALLNSKVRILTEGEKKADAIALHGYSVVGLSGVDAWRDKRSGNSEPLPELLALPWEGVEALICFDSDVTAKPSVQGALMALCFWLIEKGAKPKIVLIPPELDGQKNGADDFIARHGIEAFRALLRIARPCGPRPNREAPLCHQFDWAPEPKPTHHKALMAWSVFKETYAFRPGFGFYRWVVDHWATATSTGAESLNSPMHRWMDHLGFEQRSSSIMGSVRSELAARLEVEGWDQPDLIAFSNGTLNIATGEFRMGHRRDDWLTFCFPFPFDKGAKCPTWESFLQSTFKGDEDLVRLLRAAIRWTLIPKDRHQPFQHELAFDVHGPRRAGKGTLCEVLQSLCGGLAGGVGLIKSESFSNANALFGLIDKRVAMDPDASGRISNVGNFNSVVSNEPVEVKKLYSDCGPERLGVVVWRFFNDQPGASGGGLEGMGRRIVPFRFQQPVTNPDRQLKAKLRAETAGIFWWAWSMAEADMHDALSRVGEVKAIQEAATTAALEREPILRFLIETFPEGNPDISASDLYGKWRTWATEAGHEAGSSTRFGKEIKKVGAVVFRRIGSRRSYGIEPMDAFDVAQHIGLALPQVTGLAQPVTNPSPNPSPLNPLQQKGSTDEVTGVTGLEEKNRGQQKKDPEGQTLIGTSFSDSNPSHPSLDLYIAGHDSDLEVTGSVTGYPSNPSLDPPNPSLTRHRAPSASVAVSLVGEGPAFKPGDLVDVRDGWHNWSTGHVVLEPPGPDGLVKVRRVSGSKIAQHVRLKNVRLTKAQQQEAA